MAPSTLQDRLDFLRLDAGELARLKELRPLLEENSVAFWEALLARMLEIEPIARELRRPDMREQIESLSHEYLLAFSLDHFGPEFVEQRRGLGRALQQFGMATHWVARGYALYFSLLAPIVTRAYQGEGRADVMMRAVSKRIALEAEIVLEAYIESQQHDLRARAAQLAEARRKLQHDLGERSEQLRRTSERARAAEELASIATLVAGLAHEIGTPMSVIQGHAKMLERSVHGDEEVWRLRTIQEQIDRISRIMDTLLGIAKPHRPNKRPVELGPLLEDSLEFVADALRRRGIRVKTELVRTPEVLADPERLQQLFLNLFLNAADAMPDGGELRVALGEADGVVAVRVADTGVGIEPEAQGRIFEPFFTTKEAGHGNGLGLVVCKGIVADHHGRIEVDSRPAGGTEFTITIPAVSDDAATDAGAAKSPIPTEGRGRIPTEDTR